MSHIYCYTFLLNLQLLPFSCKVEQNKAEIKCRIDNEGNQFGEIINFVQPGFPFLRMDSDISIVQFTFSLFNFLDF